MSTDVDHQVTGSPPPPPPPPVGVWPLLHPSGTFNFDPVLSQPQIQIAIDNKLVDLPSLEVIIELCRKHAAASPRTNFVRGLPLTEEARGPVPYAWVKYDLFLSMNEALTQEYVGKAFNDKTDAAVRIPQIYLAFELGNRGYIIMEYIDGTICSDSDAPLVAAALQSLITLRAPTAQPGHIGGGTIWHRFFVDWESPLAYDSVKELESHINGILKFLGLASERVRFRPEVEAHGLCLCPCDMNRNNFIKDRSGKIVAIDFGMTCFLPLSFFSFALSEGDDFTQLVARHIKLPPLTNLEAMLTASYSCIQCGTNKMGIPRKDWHKFKYYKNLS